MARQRTLTQPMFQILVALGPGPLHGYGIMLELERLTGSTIGPGTLYRSIRRLVDDGLIVEVSGDPDDERRRAYRLSEQGAALAAEEAQRLNALLEKARASGILTNPNLRTAER
jgi:DNA-binding PadR family transcriptional regulator